MTCVFVCVVRRRLPHLRVLPPQAFTEALLEPACQAFWRPADSKLKGDWSRLALGKGGGGRQDNVVLANDENCGGLLEQHRTPKHPES